MQSQRHVVERSCVACRRKGGQQEFLRYVVGPDGRIVVDYRHRLPGRGAYTCIDRACISRALMQGGFARAFRSQLPVVEPETFFVDVANAISHRAQGLLGIARKAGNVVSGTSQLLSAFGRGEIRFLLVAEDAAEGSADKMIRLAEQGSIGWARFADQEKLGRLAGRENRNCIGIKDEQFAGLLAFEITRLQQISGEN